jgi:succinate dehydrogenase / fumarate reductase, cytochrome b subunit
MLPASSVGRKLLMAVTGQLLILFIIAHVTGNSTIYFSNLNAYAAGLRALPVILWAVRLGLLTTFLLHIIYGIALTLENNSARPQPYAVQENLTSTFAGRNMIWTGTIIGSFLIYHLLHFTFQVTNPAISAINNPDATGRPDVFLMVVRSFRNTGIVAAYLVGVTALWLHLSHGIQSTFQTFGLNSERTFPYIKGGGSVVAVILLLAYAAIPVVVVAGILTR